jgi:hypothetical protein
VVDAAKSQDAQKLATIGISIDTLSKEADEIATKRLNAPACMQG